MGFRKNIFFAVCNLAILQCKQSAKMLKTAVKRELGMNTEPSQMANKGLTRSRVKKRFCQTRPIGEPRS